MRIFLGILGILYEKLNYNHRHLIALIIFKHININLYRGIFEYKLDSTTL